MAPHLFDLPVELLELILFHVPPTLLVTRVCATCRRLHDLLQSESFWKRRYASLARTAVPPLGENLQYWQRGCVQSEFSHGLGRSHRVTNLTGKGSAIGGFDCVRLLFPEVHGAVGLVAAGSRDGCVYVWRRRGTKTASDERRSLRDSVMYTMDGHQGWVWCLTSDPHRPELLCSGGWDHTVRVWDAVIGKSVATIAKQHKAAVLSLGFPQPNCLVTSSADKHVREFDLRVPVSLTAEHHQHGKAVLALACTEGYVYSGGKEGSVCVWDRRAHSVLQTVKVTGVVRSMHYGYDKLSCVAGQAVVMMDTSQGTLEKISSYTPSHTSFLKCVIHNLGMVATASDDGSVAIHSPAPDHTHMATLQHHTRGVTGLDCSQNSLAMSSSDQTVSLWTPQYIT